jgi:hypothetical protein
MAPRVEGDYAADGYALLRGLVPRELCWAFLYRLKADFDRTGGVGKLIRNSGLTPRDVPELYSYHYPPMLGLLWGMTPTLCTLTGRDLLPTYSYFRLYREGDTLHVHSDRPSCEHSVSLTLDYSDGEPWALELASEPEAKPRPTIEPDFAGAAYRSLMMEPGDGVLYRGVQHRHGRLMPNRNAWSAHLFLHWVERDGPFASHAFDGNQDECKPVNFSF